MDTEQPSVSHRRGARVLVALLAAVLLAWIAAGPARADEGPSQRAAVLCEQAVALIANDAGDTRVAESIHEALAARDTRGVHMAMVARAHALIDHPGQDPAATARARALLLASIGGRLPSAPRGGRPVTGAETGTKVILGPLGHQRGVSDGGDAALLGLALAAIAAGLYLARRLRPPHTLHQLTHPAGGGKETRTP
jgi:hypothetical protein